MCWDPFVTVSVTRDKKHQRIVTAACGARKQVSFSGSLTLLLENMLGLVLISCLCVYLLLKTPENSCVLLAYGTQNMPKSFAQVHIFWMKNRNQNMIEFPKKSCLPGVKANLYVVGTRFGTNEAPLRGTPRTYRLYTHVGLVAVLCILRLGKDWAPKYFSKYQIPYRMIRRR